MSQPALTHHQIVRVAEPFVRQGWRVDLAASDRNARRIAFQAVDRPGDSAGAPACVERLVLECVSDTHFQVVRALTPGDGPAASVSAQGRDAAELLARATSVPVAQLFSTGPGWRVARHYDTQLPPGSRPPASTDATPPLVLARADLQAGGMTLAMVLRLPGLRSVAADLTLVSSLSAADGTQPGQAPPLPEDLLAVLGWDWARLVRDKQGWNSKLRLRGPVLRRSRTAEQALDRAGVHLAHVLAGPPGRFHDEHWLARWGVVLRRGLPSITALGMVAGALLLAFVGDRSNTGMYLALHYLPIALLAVAFSLQELPRFEIPPLPRRSAAPRWGDGGLQPAAGGQATA